MRTPRFYSFAGALALGTLIAGCNSSNNPITGLGPSGSQATLVFVNGSPDAGPVEVVVDNTEQFCTGGNTGAGCAISYGQITSVGQVHLKAGSHSISLRDTNGNTVAVSTSSFSVNAGTTYSLVLAGELHPSYAASPTLELVTFNDQPFSSSPSVDFHNASPFVQSTNGNAAVQFGYYNGATPAANPLGQPAAFGSSTTPQAIPAAAQNQQITFYAVSPTSGFSAGPSVADTVNCAGNQLPCSNTTGHLAMYLIDGPAASTAPVGANGSASAQFAGAFVP